MIEIKHVELDRESLKITTENLFYTLKNILVRPFYLLKHVTYPKDF